MRAWMGVILLWTVVAVAVLWFCASEATSKQLEVTLGANRLLAKHRISVAGPDPFEPLEEKLPPSTEIPEETLAVDFWIVNDGLRPIGAPGSPAELKMVLPETLYVFDFLLRTEAVVEPTVDRGGPTMTLGNLMLLPGERVLLDVFLVPQIPEGEHFSMWDWPQTAPTLEARGDDAVEIRYLDQLHRPDDWRVETSQIYPEKDRSGRIARTFGDVLVWVFLVSVGLYFYLWWVRSQMYEKDLRARRLAPVAVFLLGLALLVALLQLISQRIPTVPGLLLTASLEAIGQFALVLGLAVGCYAIWYLWKKGERWYQTGGAPVSLAAGVVTEIWLVVKLIGTIYLLRALLA